MEKKKRRNYTIEFKRTILSEVDKGHKKIELCRKYGLSSSTLSTILAQRDSIIKNSFSMGPKRLKMIPPTFPDVDKAVFEWFRQARCKNLTITGPILSKKALNFASMLGHTDFKASMGWLNGFRNRYGILSGIKRSLTGLRNEWKQLEMQDILEKYNKEDIYTAAETALFFQSTPARSFLLTGECCRNGEFAELRITLLLCTNATGSDLVKPLVIGNEENPKSLENVTTLFCDYQNSPKSWMDDKIFNEWIITMDKRFRDENRKVLLFVSNCSLHNEALKLKCSNINLQYLPPIFSSVIQPFDAGIFKALKANYRERFVQKLILNNSQMKETDIDLRQAFDMLVNSWRSISEETIQNCWAQTKILSLNDKPMETQPVIIKKECDEEKSIVTLWKKLPTELNPGGISFQDYVSVDDNVLIGNILSDQEIVEMANDPTRISTEFTCNVLQMVEPEVPKRTSATMEALEWAEKIQVYLEGMENVPGEIFYGHGKIKDLLTEIAVKECTQNTN